MYTFSKTIKFEFASARIAYKWADGVIRAARSQTIDSFYGETELAAAREIMRRFELNTNAWDGASGLREHFAICHKVKGTDAPFQRGAIARTILRNRIANRVA